MAAGYLLSAVHRLTAFLSHGTGSGEEALPLTEKWTGT